MPFEISGRVHNRVWNQEQLTHKGSYHRLTVPHSSCFVAVLNQFMWFHLGLVNIDRTYETIRSSRYWDIFVGVKVLVTVVV